MKFATEDGKEYEFKGRYDYPKPGDHFLSDVGEVRPWKPLPGHHYTRAIVRPVTKRHTFGGVVFEETGEKRCPRKGEWFHNLDNDFAPTCAKYDYERNQWDILRPVALDPEVHDA